MKTTRLGYERSGFNLRRGSRILSAAQGKEEEGCNSKGPSEVGQHGFPFGWKVRGSRRRFGPHPTFQIGPVTPTMWRSGCSLRGQRQAVAPPNWRPQLAGLVPKDQGKAYSPGLENSVLGLGRACPTDRTHLTSACCIRGVLEVRLLGIPGLCPHPDPRRKRNMVMIPLTRCQNAIAQKRSRRLVRKPAWFSDGWRQTKGIRLNDGFCSSPQ